MKKNEEKHLKYSEGNQPKQINTELPPCDKVITIKITIQTKMPLLKLNYQSEKCQTVSQTSLKYMKSPLFFLVAKIKGFQDFCFSIKLQQCTNNVGLSALIVISPV